MIVALYGGSLPLPSIEKEARRYGNRVLERFASKFGPQSLDAELSEDFSLVQTLADVSARTGLRKWALRFGDAQAAELSIPGSDSRCTRIIRRGRDATQLYDFSIDNRFGVRVEKPVASALARRAGLNEDAVGSPIRIFRHLEDRGDSVAMNADTAGTTSPR
jgi:hypothetical protein